MVPWSVWGESLGFLFAKHLGKFLIIRWNGNCLGVLPCFLSQFGRDCSVKLAVRIELFYNSSFFRIRESIGQYYGMFSCLLIQGSYYHREISFIDDRIFPVDFWFEGGEPS